MPPFFAVIAGIGVGLAYCLTAIRAPTSDPGVARPEMAANAYGKWKFVTESAGLIACFIGLGAGLRPFIWLGMSLSCAALALAALSLRGKLRELRNAKPRPS